MSNAVIEMEDVDLSRQRVLLREDFNVPMQNGVITDDQRIQRALPTLRACLAQNAALMVMSHLGRPEPGEFSQAYSLEPVADVLRDALGQDVRFVDDWINGVDVEPGEIVLLENVRFLKGEMENDSTLSRKMAALCDVFVMDAFAAAHRQQASTVGVAKYAKTACAGPLLVEEIDALDRALEQPKEPVVAVVGGAKVSSKIHLLETLLTKVDTLIVGGGIANTLLLAKDVAVGQSLVERDQLRLAKRLLRHAKARHVQIPLPTDVRVAPEFAATAQATVRDVSQVGSGEMILDVGPATAASYAHIMQQAGTIIWNGPVGVFEFPAFAEGTRLLSQAIASSDAFSIAGGGDTLCAIAQFGVADNISYISTGGGAFLEYLQEEKLPAIAMLHKRAKRYVK